MPSHKVMDGLSIASPILSGVNVAVKFAKFIIDIAEAPEEARVFSRLIRRVYQDHEEAVRLLANPAVEARLLRDVALKEYIEGTIRSTLEALAKIGRVLEKIRVDEQSKNHVRFDRRLNWVVQFKSKANSREKELSTCHRTLLRVIGDMRHWIEASCTTAQPAPPPYQADNDDAFLKLYNKRRNRPGKASLESSSIQLVPVEKSVTAQISRESFELPDFGDFGQITFEDDEPVSYDTDRNNPLSNETALSPSSSCLSLDSSSPWSSIFSPLDGSTSSYFPSTPLSPVSPPQQLHRMLSADIRPSQSSSFERLDEIEDGNAFQKNQKASMLVDNLSNQPPSIVLSSSETLIGTATQPDVAKEQAGNDRRKLHGYQEDLVNRHILEVRLLDASLEEELDHLLEKKITTTRLQAAKSVPETIGASSTTLHDPEVSEEPSTPEPLNILKQDEFIPIPRYSVSDTISVVPRPIDDTAPQIPESQRSSLLVMSGGIRPLSQCTASTTDPPVRVRSVIENRRARRRLIASGSWQSPSNLAGGDERQ